MALTASQRITLIKVIGQRLGEEEWPLIDLTLTQFFLPSTDSWSGTKQSYVQTMVAKAKDEQLIELGEHVGYHLAEISGPSVEPAFWQKDMLRLFISGIRK